MSDFFHSFPAVRGIQAGRPCYIAMCPLRVIPKIFVFNEFDVPADMRAQRTLNKNRIPEIANYLVENRNEYTFSSLTASINGQVKFDSMSDEGPGKNMGTLQISMDAQILLNDGQHRRAAIEEAINEMPELGHDQISVVFYLDDGLTRSQQMFADLNKHAIRPSTSISTLYDHREALSNLARHIMTNVHVFSRLTETEKASISNRSTKLFTLSSIKNSSQVLLSKKKNASISEEEMALAVEFWKYVCDCMDDWKLASDRQINTSELREEFIHAHGIALQAIGSIGAEIIHDKSAWVRLKKLNSVDWSRKNKEWMNRAMMNGRISKSSINIQLTASLIKQKLGLKLNDKQRELEEGLVKHG
jgi:DNA sulfur modification protein DndB